MWHERRTWEFLVGVIGLVVWLAILAVSMAEWIVGLADMHAAFRGGIALAMVLSVFGIGVWLGYRIARKVYK